MISFFKSFLIFSILNLYWLSASEFTISSYNCGGLSSHYDYLRAACMEKIMQERYQAEPLSMSLNEKIQNVALKILFAEDNSDALREWEEKGYEELSHTLTATPHEEGSVNQPWNEKAEEMITSYKVRPVILYDESVAQRLEGHLNDLTGRSSLPMHKKLREARKIMAERIFADHLTQDILCLQEADYLDVSMFPENYEVLFSETDHSKNGIAWNKERFILIQTFGNILGRAFVVKLRDKETNKTLIVASAHLTGCNPYRIEKNDSATGDRELCTMINLMNEQKADLSLIGMDSNVTSLHPRLQILKDAGYRLDCENFLSPTCTNPYQVLDTRIDWIALHSDGDITITNVPILSIGLNNIRTNVSDHKPVAAKIEYIKK